MRQLFLSTYNPAGRNRWQHLLAFFWILGFVFGFVLYRAAEDNLISMMRIADAGSVSIVSLLLTDSLPFLFTAMAVFCCHSSLLMVICFCEAALLSFVTFGVRCSYSSAGWLMSGILLADRWICAWILYFCWFKFLSGPKIRGIS